MGGPHSRSIGSWPASTLGSSRPAWRDHRGSPVPSWCLTWTPWAPGVLAFSPDGQRVLTSAARFIDLWDVGTGRLLRRFSHRTSPSVSALAFAPDGQAFIAGNGSGNRVHLRNATTGEVLAEFAGHSGRVTVLTFTPDGLQIVTGSADQTLRLWDTRGRELRRFAGHTGAVTCAVLSPDGRTLVSGRADGSLRVWEVGSGTELRRLDRADTKLFTAVAFAPDGKHLLAGGKDGLALWEFASGKVEGAVRRRGGGRCDRCRQPDACLGGRRNRGGPFGPDEPGKWNCPARHARRPATSSRRLLSGWTILLREQRRRSPLLCDCANRQLPSARRCRRGATMRRGFAGRRLPGLFGGQDRLLYLWDLRQRREVQRLAGHDGPIASVTFSPDGGLLLSASRDGTARLWETVSGREVRELRGGQPLASAVFSPDGRSVLGGLADGTGRLWEVATGGDAEGFPGDETRDCFVVRFSPDGKHVLTKGRRLWETATGTEVSHYPASGLYAPVFTPDGQLAGSNGGKLKDSILIWDPKAGREFGSSSAIRRW